MIHLPDLPYTVDALEPIISGRTIEIHYGKHHKAYVEKTNALLAGSPLADASLEDIIKQTVGHEAGPLRDLHNNAAQVWNHSFYWRSMRYRGGGEPIGAVRSLIDRSFKTFDLFAQAFMMAATQHFGSGWIWLVLDDGRARVVATDNAETPFTEGKIPLLVLDLWEHAYYLDHQNRRADYVAGFLKGLVNWEFARLNLASHERLAAE